MIKEWVAKVLGFEEEINNLKDQLNIETSDNSEMQQTIRYLSGQLANSIQEQTKLSALYEALEMKYDKKDKAYKELSRKFRALKPRLVKKYGGEK